MLPDREPIYKCDKDTKLSSICDFTKKYIHLPKWSCVLNCFCEYPGVLVPDSEINGNKYMDLPFITFHPYYNIISCSLAKTAII